MQPMQVTHDEFYDAKAYIFFVGVFCLNYKSLRDLIIIGNQPQQHIAHFFLLINLSNILSK